MEKGKKEVKILIFFHSSFLYFLSIRYEATNGQI